ncbi:hypothetical protein L3Q82_003917 [Scortum barcoo]|uniref:Uncharacterized protein n=1 Tax=Scortum barcoo TaxID=214431 RepID=A0ACB8X6P1_9TELE|nr:hypothetical protein L3Q82_003917 [Scortum barcoo]
MRQPGWIQQKMDTSHIRLLQPQTLKAVHSFKKTREKMICRILLLITLTSCVCVSMKVLRSQSLRMNILQDEVQFDKDVLREGRIRLHVSRLRTDDSGLYLCEVKTNYGVSYGKCRLNVTGANREKQHWQQLQIKHKNICQSGQQPVKKCEMCLSKNMMNCKRVALKPPKNRQEASDTGGEPPPENLPQQRSSEQNQGQTKEEGQRGGLDCAMESHSLLNPNLQSSEGVLSSFRTTWQEFVEDLGFWRVLLLLVVIALLSLGIAYYVSGVLRFSTSQLELDEAAPGSPGSPGWLWLSSLWALVLVFSRSVYTDTGLYQLTCGGLSAEIHLNVLFGFDASVSEGGPVRLDCHYSTSGSHVDSVRWEKDGKVVLERSLSSGKTEGSEPRASFPPGGDRDGDWSLLLDAARLQDEGDYFCSVHYKGAREAWGEPAAVRLKPTQIVTEEKMGACLKYVAITACVVFILVAPSFFLLGWWLKSCSCRRGPYTPVTSGQANGDLQQANGGLQQTNGDLQQANGDLQQANGGLQQANSGLQQANGDPQQANGPNREEVRINVPCEMSLLEIKNEGAPPPEDDAFP